MKLDRSLGFFDVVSIVMGAIIGVGIFFAPGKVVDITGSAGLSLGAWAIGGGIAVIGALTFAELGGILPRTGGQYLVLKESYGRFTGFLYCWSLLTVIQTGAIGIISIICVEYLATLCGVVLTGSVTMALACGLVASLAVLNCIGVRSGAGIARLTIVLKVATLLAIASIGLLFDAGETGVADRAARGDGRMGLLIPAIVPVLFSFGGWQQALYVAGEVKRPERNIPLGIILGVFAVVSLYLLVNLGYVSLLDVDHLASTSTLASDAVGAALPGIAEKIVAAAVAVSAFGIANVCMLTAPRMYKAMADDGGFFPGLARVSPRFKTPVRAIAVQAMVAILLIIVAGKGGVDWLTTGVVCIDWLFFALTGLALFILRLKKPDVPRPYRTPGYPVLPGLFVLVSVMVIVATFLDPPTRSASVVSGAVVASGCLVWMVVRKRSSES